MKKTKVVIPALGIIAFATAASITGTVAWFTASRTFTMTAGNFAVVNTKNNLQAVVTAQVGTSLSGNNIVLSDSDNKLTDASFNHRSLDCKIIAPDDDGKLYDSTHSVAIASATSTNASDLERGDGSKIYSAFTWDIEFKLNYSQSETKKIGLYFDLSKSWAHEVVTIGATEVVSAAKAGTYKPNADLTGADVVITEGSTPGAKTLYKAAPDDTGKGFRIAFVPISSNYTNDSVDNDSMGVAKVWAPHQVSANAHHIDERFVDVEEYDTSESYDTGDLAKVAGVLYKSKEDDVTGTFDSDKWDVVTTSLDALTFDLGDKTSTLMGETRTPDVDGKSAMLNGDSSALPALPAIASSASLTGKTNYLGYFKAAQGSVASIKFRCVAYYEGTDPEIVNTVETIYETMTTNLEFTTQALSD